MVADVILLTGSPGSGKTTTARSLAAAYPKAVHLHTDDFWHYIVSGAIPPHLPESDDQNQTVMAVVQRAAWTFAAGGFTTVVDGIIGPWMLRHFQGANTVGFPTPRLHYVVLRPTRDTALRRAQARTSPDALVDEVPITELWDQFADLGRFEPHVIDTTTQSEDETSDAIERAIASEAFLLS